jgi:ABC-type sugar transport system permease subunit
VTAMAEQAGAQASTSGAPRSKVKADRSESRLALWLILPSLVFLGGVVGYPIVRALWLSLYSDTITGSTKFIGLDNYKEALTGTGSTDFWNSFIVTNFFTVASVALEVVIGMAMALIMHQAFRGRGLVRTSVLVPWAIPTAVTAVMWQWMLQPDGVVNAVVHKDVIWTGSEWPSKWAIVIADTWKTSPFIALLLLAGLQIIPEDVYEAARVDGASWWQRFTRITLPLLKGSILVAVLFRLLDVLRIFDLPAILTHGANDTTTLSILGYQAAIQQTKFGYGSAISTLTFIYIFLVAFLFVKVLGASVIKTQAKGVK